MLVESEISWLRKDQLVLTINNELFLISIGATRFINFGKNPIQFGIQQVNMGLFVTCLRRHTDQVMSKSMNDIQFKANDFLSKRLHKSTYLDLSQ